MVASVNSISKWNLGFFMDCSSWMRGGSNLSPHPQRPVRSGQPTLSVFWFTTVWNIHLTLWLDVPRKSRKFAAVFTAHIYLLLKIVPGYAATVVPPLQDRLSSNLRPVSDVLFFCNSIKRSLPSQPQMKRWTCSIIGLVDNQSIGYLQKT